MLAELAQAFTQGQQRKRACSWKLPVFMMTRQSRSWHRLAWVLILLLAAPGFAYAQSDDVDAEEKTQEQLEAEQSGDEQAGKSTKTEKDGKDKKKKKDANQIKIEFNGRLMFDFDQYDGFYNEGESGSDSGLRRGRLGMEVGLKNRWSAAIEFNFGKNVDNVKVRQANFSYQGWKSLELSIGKIGEPFGLERSISSKYIPTIERSAATSAFAPSRNNGLALHSRGNKHHTWAIGLFEASETSAGVDTWALTGRYTIAPVDKKGRLLHFGLSGTWRDMGGADYEVQQEVEVNFADELDYGPKVLADDISRVGLETAWVHGPFSFQGEWFGQQLTVEDPEEDDDASYSGYYLLASVFLTGESRPYKNGEFKRVKPANWHGALELVGRYSVLDAVDNNDGIKSETVTVGVNYYAGKHVRFMLDFLDTSLSGPDADELVSGEAVSLRAQYHF